MPVFLKQCDRCTRKRKSEEERLGCPVKPTKGTRCGCRWFAQLPHSLGRKAVGKFSKKEDADAALADAVKDAKGGIAPITNQPLKAIAELFFTSVQSELAEITLRRYKSLWRWHVEGALGNTPVNVIQPATITAHYAKLQKENVKYTFTRKGGEITEEGAPLGPNTVRKVHRLLSRLFSWAESQRIISKNVMRSCKPPRATPSPAKALSPEAFNAFAERLKDEPLGPLYLFMLYTGLRRSQACALTWGDIDLETCTATISKAVSLGA